MAKKFGREVGQALGNLAGVFLALGGSAGFGALVKGQIDAADQAGKMSQKIGVAVEQLSAYQVSAALADVSNEQLQTGLQQLAKNQADFVAGTGEAQDAFRALGISQEQVNALNGDTAALFELVAGKLAGFEDGANKTALAMKFFGRSGAELIPMINSLEETRGKAEELGSVFDQQTAAAAERFNDNLTMVGISVRAVGLNIAKAVLPTLEKMSEGLLDGAKDAKEMGNAGRIADIGLKLLASAGMLTAHAFSQAGRVLGGFAAMMVALVSGDWAEAGRRAGRVAIMVAEDFIESGRKQAEALQRLWDDSASNIEKKAPETAKKLAAPALISAEMVKKAEKEKRDAFMRVYDEAVAAADADAQIQKQAADDKARMWKQVFDTIDQEQEDAIEEGKRLLDELNKGDRFAERFGDSVSGAFEDIAFNIRDAGDAVRAFGQQLARIVFQESVGNPLAAAVRAGVGSMFGGAAAGGSAGTGSFDPASVDVPAFASGTDFVPKTGLAMVHKGERIIPADENRAGMGGMVFNNTINIGAGNAVTRSEVTSALRESERRVLAVQAELRKR